MKTWKFLGAPLMLMLLAGMPWCIASAEDDRTEPVVVNAGENVTVDRNISVSNESNAVKVEAYQGEDSKDASLTVKGNVSIESDGSHSAEAVNIWGYDGRATVDISGNIIAEGFYGSVGLKASGNPYNDPTKGYATAKIGGNVTAKDNPDIAIPSTSDTYNTYGVKGMSNTNIDIGGNVSAEGQEAIGMDVFDVTAKVNGDVEAKGKYSTALYAGADENKGNVSIAKNITANGLDATGINLKTLWSQQAELSVSVGGDITTTATGTEEYQRATGIAIDSYGGKTLAEVNGDVIANSATGKANGIRIGGYWGEGDRYPGETKALVHGNLVSNGSGVCILASGTPDAPIKTEILVENEIQADEVGVGLSESLPNAVAPSDNVTDTGDSANLISAPDIHLTVWKINKNERDNVAEWITDRTMVLGDVSGMETQPTAARDFELHNIMYIIKVEQPGEGGTITAVDENGNALPKSFGFDVAHEGEKVMLKANLAEGYKIVAAYNGLGEKLPLLKDENGNYYIFVPKGGGVYLSVELEDTTEHSYSEPDDDEKNTITNDASKENSKTDDIKTEELAVSSALPEGNQSYYTQSAMPKTGDNNQITPWLVLSVVSAGGIAGMEICNKKAKRKSTN